MENNSKTVFNISTKGKELFLILSAISLFLMMVITTLLWWFISPRLHEIHNVLAQLSLTILRIFYLLLVVASVLVFLTSTFERNFLVANFAVHIFIKIMYPVTVFMGSIFGIDRAKIRESFVYVNNSFVKALNKKFKASEILILLPHCLQHTSCGVRITIDIENCKHCGNCNIGDLVELASKYQVQIAIATGGTLARRIVIKNKPKFIIAVACQRDLVSGLQDVFPIPVYGVFNQRPEGPCINTKVSISTIEFALKHIIEE